MTSNLDPWISSLCDLALVRTYADEAFRTSSKEHPDYTTYNLLETEILRRMDKKALSIEVQDRSSITYHLNDPYKEILHFSPNATRVFGEKVESSPESAHKVYRALLFWLQGMSSNVPSPPEFTKLELIQMEQISLLREIVLRTANIVDPECPDADAYLDGHCSLSEAVEFALQKGNKNV